jgi:hypothetical protein
LPTGPRVLGNVAGGNRAAAEARFTRRQEGGNTVRIFTQVLGVLMLLAAACPAWAAGFGREKPAQLRVVSWEDQARASELTWRDIAALDKNKILITRQFYTQVYETYAGDFPEFGKPAMTVFITSDSLLAGYHALYEDSIRRMEEVNARKLPPLLRNMLDNLQSLDDKDLELAKAAKRRGLIVLGTALKLLGDDSLKLPPDVADLVAKEVAKVQAATAAEKPDWIGPPDHGFMAIDYTRFKPRGFYVKTPRLQQYFRAVAWLQAIPFRSGQEEELLSILFMAQSVKGGDDRWISPKVKECEDFVGRFNKFLGKADDLDIYDAMRLGWGEAFGDEAFVTQVSSNLGPIRQKAETMVPEGQRGLVNDQIALYRAEPLPKEPSPVTFHVLSARQTPDAILFQRVTQPALPREYPSGLDLLAALGSRFAQTRLEPELDGRLLSTIDETRKFFAEPTLYQEYLDCLKILLKRPPADAPKFMFEEPWQIKSGQTVLGGWTQLRHTWVLQAKNVWCLAGEPPLPVGFVEPVPEFFDSMAVLAQHTEDLIDQAGTFDLDLAEMAADARHAADLLQSQGIDKGVELNKDGLDQEDWGTLRRAAALLGQEETFSWGDVGVFKAATVERLRAMAKQFEAGEVPNYAVFLKVQKAHAVEVLQPWTQLRTLCLRLSLLAHKQLRGVPFTEEEDRFIGTYGKELARLMLCKGEPLGNDDAPKAVDVFSHPQQGKVLEAAIGRPRAIYVLYPYKGAEVLCRGAVVPYYEFTSSERLTDQEWLGRLDSKDAPDVPEWIRPIVGTAKVKPVSWVGNGEWKPGKSAGAEEHAEPVAEESSVPAAAKE